MDPEERARRREERRKQRDENERAEAEEEERRRRREERERERDAGDTAETNGPTEENGLSNEIEEDESERLRQKQEEKQRIAADKEKRRNAEIERQRLEDEERAKAEAEGRGEKPKKKFNLLGRVSKGRKKEILQMLLTKARGDLQLEEKEAAAEKAQYINDNVKETNVESISKAQLQQLCQALHDQLQLAEGEKFDLEIKVKRRDLQISSLKVKANETRGKFVMPKLKTVAKK